jgi:metal-responsive CopG/Arc/MetJ family transcriptional regulator
VKTVHMNLEEGLVCAVDRAARDIKTTRSGFTRRALRDALARLAVARQEERHRRGYQRAPAAAAELGGWESEQAWGDE